MGLRLWLSDKTVRKLAELPIYCQRQKCSPGNVASLKNRNFLDRHCIDMMRQWITTIPQSLIDYCTKICNLKFAMNIPTTGFIKLTTSRTTYAWAVNFNRKYVDHLSHPKQGGSLRPGLWGWMLLDRPWTKTRFSRSSRWARKSERDLPVSERENGWWVAYGSTGLAAPPQEPHFHSQPFGPRASLFFILKHLCTPKRSWKISHGGPGKILDFFLSGKEWEPCIYL